MKLSSALQQVILQRGDASVHPAVQLITTHQRCDGPEICGSPADEWLSDQFLESSEKTDRTDARGKRSGVPFTCKEVLDQRTCTAVRTEVKAKVIWRGRMGDALHVQEGCHPLSQMTNVPEIACGGRQVTPLWNHEESLPRQ
ncbi:hypothetical protein AVEN_40549-1 [Araneus ventricosus]|uniref:Uncharacterized protein n=1 Tax=Araneus ventricosus TaxID=182803 RepID=A0A4Y2UAC9_ARAVE|nr:hypothetical protein AVEN_40549-1 [Araneus ventricosus]